MITKNRQIEEIYNKVWRIFFETFWDDKKLCNESLYLTLDLTWRVLRRAGWYTSYSGCFSDLDLKSWWVEATIHHSSARISMWHGLGPMANLSSGLVSSSVNILWKRSLRCTSFAPQIQQWLVDTSHQWHFNLPSHSHGYATWWMVMPLIEVGTKPLTSSTKRSRSAHDMSAI